MKLARTGITVPGRVSSHIDGAAAAEDAGRATVEVLYPATEEHVLDIQEADAGEVDAAVAAARRAFADGPWPRLATAERLISGISAIGQAPAE